MATGKTRHYVPQLPQNLPPEQIIVYLFNELQEVSKAFDQLGNNFVFETLNVAPPRPRDGLTVLADGTNWNPGSGQGVYTYYNSTWNKLG